MTKKERRLLGFILDSHDENGELLDAYTICSRQRIATPREARRSIRLMEINGYVEVEDTGEPLMVGVKCSGGAIRKGIGHNRALVRVTDSGIVAAHRPPGSFRAWADSEKSRLVRLRSSGLSWAEIGRVIDRGRHSCSAKYREMVDDGTVSVYE